MAGRGKHLKTQAARCDKIAVPIGIGIGQQIVAHTAGVVLIGLTDIDPRVRHRAQVFKRADMIKMRVCQQNCLQRQSLLFQRGQQPLGVRSGVNNDSTAAFFRAHQIAVGGQRPQRKRLNIHSVSLFEIVRIDDQGHRPVVF